MILNVNDQVKYDDEIHTVLRRHVTYELDGICVPVSMQDIEPLHRDAYDAAIVKELCKLLDVTYKDIVKGYGPEPIRMARNVIYYYLHEQMGWPYLRIGKALAHHHASAIFGARRHADLLSLEDSDVELINEKLNRYDGLN